MVLRRDGGKKPDLTNFSVGWEMCEICYIPLIVLQFKVVPKNDCHCPVVGLMLT